MLFEVSMSVFTTGIYDSYLVPFYCDFFGVDVPLGILTLTIFYFIK